MARPRPWPGDGGDHSKSRLAVGAEAMADSVQCPNCGSEQITADKKGFGLGKAVGGALLAGPVGLLGGFLGSKKVIVTCLKCGNQWKAGKA